MHWHESATGVHEFPILNPPPTPYHLSGSSPCTSPKHPVSCIEHRLAICFSHDSIQPWCTPFLILHQSVVPSLFLFFLNLFLLYFALQYCIGFAIHWHESTTGVHAFPNMTPYHLSGSSPCTSPKHPVSCIEHRLAIRFLHDSIHVSMPFSQIIPPSPSESKSPLYTSVSLLLSRIQGHHYHLSKFRIYVSVYYIGVFLSGLLHSV